jgi:hypothetical protein
VDTTMKRVIGVIDPRRREDAMPGASPLARGA